MKFWRIFMFAAAAFNLLIGVGGLLDPAATVEGRMTGLLVACFGVVYALVATDIARYRPMLWAGVIGKFGAVALLGPEVAAGAYPAFVGPILVGDAIFATAFLWLLMKPPAWARMNASDGDVL
ncbi:hypothetical protein [Altererythrobacter sp. MF3-039]|uniref:hypothetical protein n=1 Tax=Altererythrobacter sp. MF3-039 TaxID=3252901 RepID=UPI00390C5E75